MIESKGNFWIDLLLFIIKYPTLMILGRIFLKYNKEWDTILNDTIDSGNFEITDSGYYLKLGNTKTYVNLCKDFLGCNLNNSVRSSVKTAMKLDKIIKEYKKEKEEKYYKELRKEIWKH